MPWDLLNRHPPGHDLKPPTYESGLLGFVSVPCGQVSVPIIDDARIPSPFLVESNATISCQYNYNHQAWLGIMYHAQCMFIFLQISPPTENDHLFVFGNGCLISQGTDWWNNYYALDTGKILLRWRKYCGLTYILWYNMTGLLVNMKVVCWCVLHDSRPN